MTSEHRPIDELANALTHGWGLFLSAVASVFLIWIVRDQGISTLVACCVYCATLTLLYAASTLSHSFHDLEWRRFFRTLDQACIFLLIAGSFTPIATMFLNHGWWKLLLPAMWLLTFAGVFLVLRIRNMAGAAKVVYVALGWLPAIALWELYQRAPAPLLYWLLAGGGFYSVGTLFLRYSDRVRYLHALWHAFVIAGSVCHYIVILVYVAEGR